MKPIVIIILVVLFLAVLVMGFYLFAKNKQKETTGFIPLGTGIPTDELVEAPTEAAQVIVPNQGNCPPALLIPVPNKEWYCNNGVWDLRIPQVMAVIT